MVPSTVEMEEAYLTLHQLLSNRLGALESQPLARKRDLKPGASVSEGKSVGSGTFSSKKAFMGG